MKGEQAWRPLLRNSVVLLNMIGAHAFHVAPVGVALRGDPHRGQVAMCTDEAPTWMDRILYGRQGRRSQAKQTDLQPQTPPEPAKRYIPPEEWVGNDGNQTRLELLWERRVQFEAQRYGNRYRQDGILKDELGKG